MIEARRHCASARRRMASAKKKPDGSRGTASVRQHPRVVWGNMLGEVRYPGVQKKVDRLRDEGRSEKRRLIDMAETDIKGDVANIEHGCFEFYWLDPMVVQPRAHIAHEQPDGTTARVRDPNEH
jgi:hypothetical protein